MTQQKRKLVLFDIDGTLIRHFGPEPGINVGWHRITFALKKVLNIDVIPSPEINYHGSVDRAILFDISSRYGITKNQFDKKFDDLKAAIV